jgi:hypothetical protein
MVVDNNKIEEDKKFTSNAGNFYHHADPVVQCGAHPLIEHIWASLEATGCSQRASAWAALPRRPPWSTTLLQNTKHKMITTNHFQLANLQ